MQMTSRYINTEVVTVFVHSEKPIFPPNVFNNYGKLFGLFRDLIWR